MPTYTNIDEDFNFKQKLDRENEKIDKALLDDDKDDELHPNY